MREGIIKPNFADKFFHLDFENSPIPVLCLYPIPAPVPLDAVEIQACALEKHPRNIVWKALESLPRVRLKLPLICQIFNWSEEIEWEGIRLVDFLDFFKIETHPEGYYAFYSRDGAFFETLSRDEARDPRVLLAYGLNGSPLPLEHGGPLRLVVPFLQGYKSVKWIESIRAFRHDPKGLKRLLGQSPTAQLNETWREKFGIEIPQGKAGDPPALSPPPLKTFPEADKVTTSSTLKPEIIQGQVMPSEFSGHKGSQVYGAQEQTSLCEIVAVLRVGKREAIRKALEQIGIPAYTTHEALGRSRQRGLRFKSAGSERQEKSVTIKFLPKEVFIIFAETSLVQKVVQVIMKINRTGKGQYGDGKIFVLGVEQAIRISTDERGTSAV